MTILDIILNFVKENSKELYSKIKFDLDNIDLVYTHTLPSNDTDMVRNIVNLANSGVLAPRIALQGLSFIPNVDEYIKEMNKWNVEVDIRKNVSKNNNGVNDTNLERQNKDPITQSQEKNLANDTLGKSEDLSDNKV